MYGQQNIKTVLQ